MSVDPASASENKGINKNVIEAVNLLAHGKRNILCGEISQAVTQLQEACRILGLEYGELADECADAYLWYGKALLELSRLESGVLGDAIPGGESDASESSGDDSSEEQNSVTEDNGAEDEMEDGVMSEDLEEEETRETVSEAEATTGDQCINGSRGVPDGTNLSSPCKTEAVGSGTEVAGSVQEDKCQGGEGDAGSNQEGGSAIPGPSEAEEGSSSGVPGTSKSEDTEDISNLQLAWEMLELSKIIYNRHDRSEMKLKLAETCLRLGEIGMETEQYDQAISDLTQCLQIQKQILVPEDRRLAETLYQLGLACTYCRQYDSAVEYYHSAIAVIQAKIDRLSRIVSGEIPPDPVENGDGFYTPLELAQKEIEELQELLPDIAAKIDDVRDEQGEADKVKVMMRESLTPPGPVGTSTGSQQLDGSGDGASSSSTCSFKALPTASVQPVNNISHLVRKKRKSEDDQKLKCDLLKRQKTSDAATSGSSKTVPVGGEAPDGKKTDPAFPLDTGVVGSNSAPNN